MPLSLHRLFFFALLYSVAAAAGAATGTEALLQRMARSMYSANYEGLLLNVQWADGISHTMHVTHFHDEQHGVRERLVSLDGPLREVLHVGDRCTCVWPQAGLVVSGHSPSGRGHLAAERFAATGPLSQHYDFIEDGEDRVAEMSCRLVRLVPKDAYRYGHRLCIHDPSGMLLRLEVLDGDTRLETSQFISLRNVPQMNEEATRLATDIQGFRVIEVPAAEQPGESPSEPHWAATSLPPGYVLRYASRRRSPHSGKELEHLIYSDGLGNVSVFIERLSTPAPREAPVYGAMRRLTRQVDGFNLTAIGQAPEAALRMILEGMRPIEDR